MLDPSARHQSMVQFLTTEHFTLQTARSATIAESNGRASLFLGSVSSGVVALALVAQVSRAGTAFFGFAAVLLPVLFFLGVATVSRLTTSAMEYWIYSRSINRVRRFYVDSVPEVAKYLALPVTDDFVSTAASHGIRTSKLGILVTLVGSICVITSVMAGVFFGMLVELFLTPPALVSGGVGVLSFVLAAFLLFWRQSKKFLGRAHADLVLDDASEDSRSV